MGSWFGLAKAESPKPWFWGPLLSRRAPSLKGPAGGGLLVHIRQRNPRGAGSRAENETSSVFRDEESAAAVGLEGIGAGRNGGLNLREKRCRKEGAFAKHWRWKLAAEEEGEAGRGWRLRSRTWGKASLRRWIEDCTRGGVTAGEFLRKQIWGKVSLERCLRRTRGSFA